ncbi:thiamine pyrophosphate-binding protein [Nocardia vaccinii]|uniref:thiamine pyrophosphate-binding protein n=1 Tax=Nocardia vaccinii TaxID=1822 RepID=UPI000A074AD6|nr:thiamine pyrophosphate-binding protein [Nocardia vaccinii]
MKIRESLADAVVGEGVDTVFALMGGANRNLMCDLEQRNATVIQGRHEAAVVSMADGYARFSGRIGVATVTAGPGVTNTATALAVARSHRSPVLMLAGGVPLQDTGNPQYIDQLAFGRIVAGRAGEVVHPDVWPAEWARAVTVLRDGLPYLLSLPVDVQDSSGRAPVSSEKGCAASGEAVGDVTAAAGLLAEAAQVGIVAGAGAVAARDELRALADRLGAVLTTTVRTAGLFVGHPMDAGVVSALGDGRALRALARCDVILAVGTSLHRLAVPGLPEHIRIIRIDTDAVTVASASRTSAAIEMTAIRATTLLNESLSSLPARETSAAVRRIVSRQHRIDDRPWLDGEDSVDPRHALADLAAFLPDPRGVVIGGGHCSMTACQMIAPTRHDEWTCVSVDFGAIGQSLPVAMGACFARPDLRIFLITGDGDLMMSLAELDTAVRYGLDLTVIVLNDSGFGHERHDLREHRQPTDFADYGSPDFVSIASALGARGYRIEGPNQLPELKRALSPSRGVVLVDIRTTSDYLNPAASVLAGSWAAKLP